MPSEQTLDEWAGRLHRLADGRLERRLRATMLQQALMAEGEARQISRTRLKWRTGELQRSLTGIPHRRGLGWDLRGGGRVRGNDLRYVRTQEEGATITGKPWLTIPTKRAQTAAGVTRQRARDYPDLFFIRRGSRLFLARREGQSIRIYFTLVRRVTIRAKWFMRQGFYNAVEQTDTLVIEALDRAFAEEV